MRASKCSAWRAPRWRRMTGPSASPADAASPISWQTYDLVDHREIIDTTIGSPQITRTHLEGLEEGEEGRGLGEDVLRVHLKGRLLAAPVALFADDGVEPDVVWGKARSAATHRERRRRRTDAGGDARLRLQLPEAAHRAGVQPPRLLALASHVKGLRAKARLVEGRKRSWACLTAPRSWALWYSQ